MRKKIYNFAENPDDILKKHNEVVKNLNQGLYPPYSLMSKGWKEFPKSK